MRWFNLKRFLALLLILLILMVLFGCSNEITSPSLKIDGEYVFHINSLVAPQKFVQDEKISNYFLAFLGDTPQDFIKYLNSNQIDVRMREEGELLFSAADINNWISQYHSIWENEMNIVYENLLFQLNGDARRMIEESQASWEIMNKHSSYLWHEIFVLSKGRGSGDASMIHMQSMYRVRERTFLLAEYYYWLTGDFTFSLP